MFLPPMTCAGSQAHVYCTVQFLLFPYVRQRIAAFGQTPLGYKLLSKVVRGLKALKHHETAGLLQAEHPRSA